ncbi:MAG: hypothetical protein U0835_16695 [Isosphaeraceae bacterium]
MSPGDWQSSSNAPAKFPPAPPVVPLPPMLSSTVCPRWTAAGSTRVTIG